MYLHPFTLRSGELDRHSVVYRTPHVDADEGRPAEAGATIGNPMNTAPAAQARHLTLVPRDDKAAAIEDMERKIDGPIRRASDLREWDGFCAQGQTTFRFVTSSGKPFTAHLPNESLTPHVRAIIFELVEAVESAIQR